MLYVWIAALAIFVIVELATPQLVSIWFAIGAFIGLICELIGLAVWLQILIFIAVSVVAVLVTRPLYRKYFKTKHIKTNTDALIGKEGIVTAEIDNINGKGLVKILGQVWSAKSADNEIIPCDTYVEIENIEGVKLIVKRKKV